MTSATKIAQIEQREGSKLTDEARRFICDACGRGVDPDGDAQPRTTLHMPWDITGWYCGDCMREDRHG